MLGIEEAIRAFKDFEARATAARSTQLDRIKEDRSVLAGDQWSKADRKLVGRNRSRRTVNVTANAVNNIVNEYISFEFAYFSGDPDIDGMMSAWLKAKANAHAVKEGLRGSVAFGLSYLCLGTDTISDAEGEEEIPVVYTVRDITNILFDPDSTALDGSDAMEAAIVELRSTNYVKNRYGEQFAECDGLTPIATVSYNHNERMMAIVTYYKVEDGACTCYTIIGDKFLYDPVRLPIDRPPVIPVYGEQTWDDDEVVYQGVVRKGTPVQSLINLAFTQLGERLAMAPKPTIIADPEAVEGYTEGYKNFCYNLNPLLLYNPFTADGKRQLPEPKRMDNMVQFADLTGIIDSNLGLMSAIVGVDTRSVFDTRTQLTATEVLTTSEMYQKAIRHYFDNLRVSFKCMGELVLKLFGVGSVTLDVTQGPSEKMARQVARNELITLAGIVPEQQKPAIVDGILKASGDNAILRDTYGEIHKMPAPTAMEGQMADTIEQMKQAIEERDVKMREMQEQLDFYEKSTREQDRNLEAQFAEIDLRHQHDLQKMAFKAQLDAGLNAGQAESEAVKNAAEIEKQGIALETARVKGAAEQVKAFASMIPKKEVTTYED